MPASVPDEVLTALADRYDVPVSGLERLGGGEPWSDGVRYAMPGEHATVLKVQATSVADAVGWLPGRTLGSLPREERTPYLTTLGRTLGRMHATSRRLPAWRASPTTVDERPVLSWEAEWQHFADTCPDPAVGHVWSQIRRELAEVPIERDGFGFVHNDPHLHSQVTHLVDGYLTAYPLDQRWIDALPLFIEYRRALLLMAMHAELPQQVRAAWHTEPWSTVGPRSTRRGRC